MHRSFVGSPSLGEVLRFLRMTARGVQFVILTQAFGPEPREIRRQHVSIETNLA